MFKEYNDFTDLTFSYHTENFHMNATIQSTEKIINCQLNENVFLSPKTNYRKP